jgi:hypothetical protein
LPEPVIIRAGLSPAPYRAISRVNRRIFPTHPIAHYRPNPLAVKDSNPASGLPAGGIGRPMSRDITDVILFRGAPPAISTGSPKKRFPTK